jgi:8-oxo-dGTP diphosphatase
MTNTETQLAPWTRVAAYALATDGEGRLLLVRVAPGYLSAGNWTLPGGGIDFGEDPAAAVLRELSEETGLVGEIKSLAFVDSARASAGVERGRSFGPYHAIRIVYHLVITGGELRDELDESTDAAGWFSSAEIAQLPTVELVATALRRLDAG